MNILIACEESQAVTVEMRKLGHQCFSCDIQECSGGHPEWHIKGDVLPLLNGDCTFQTMDGTTHTQPGRWDLIIAHPPCTYLSGAGNGYLNVEKYGSKAIQRKRDQSDAAEFFMKFINADCEKIAVENPVGYMNSHYRKPDQIIEPYYFATDNQDKINYHRKKTCLWLKNLEPLERTSDLSAPQPTYRDKTTGKARYYTDAIPGSCKNTRKRRSKTFPGVARAMANAWAGKCEEGTAPFAEKEAII